MSRAVLAFRGLRVLAEAAPGHLEWLEEFLGPAFERADGHEADWRVSLVEDRNRYRQAIDRGPADGTLEAFAYDAKVVGLPRWRTEAGDTGLFDAVRGLYFEVAYASRAVTLLTEPGNVDGRIALMRIVRELSMNRAQRRGGLLLHAAAMAVGDRGIVITGPKGAGKTSLLIHALRARSARYVSNDRVVVPAAESRPSATGVPTIVALRRGTLDLFPSLAARAAAHRRPDSRPPPRGHARWGPGARRARARLGLRLPPDPGRSAGRRAARSRIGGQAGQPEPRTVLPAPRRPASRVLRDRGHRVSPHHR